MVYLLHFDQPYKHAQHYIGYASRLEARLEHHRNGTGARLMQVVRDAGITWRLARVWEDGDRSTERRLKNWHKSADLCPICRAAKKQEAINA